MQSRHWVAGVMALLVSSSAQGQGIGSYLNFESPALKPVAVATIVGDSYLLVCNGPDHSVEVYATTDHRFIARVPVGAEPISIAVKPSALPSGGRRCYVANWLGDSITSFDLEPVEAGDPQARVLRTVHVGDEPMMIAFVPADESLLVTFSAQAAWGWF